MTTVMPAKEILFFDDARSRLLRGITTLADAVRVTLGPRARTVILDRPYGAPIVFNQSAAGEPSVPGIRHA